MSKKATRIIAILAIVVILGYLIYPRADKNSTSVPEPVGAGNDSPPPATPVDAVIASPTRLAEVLNVSGTIYPDEEITLTSEVNGLVTRIYFNEGSYVAKDKLLIKVDDSELQASLNKVKFQIDLARQQKERKEKLLKIGGISQEEYDQALTEYNTLEAEAKLLEVRIQKTEIRAPFSGTVGLRQISAGSYITPGTPVANLVKTQPVKIEFSVPEKYGPRIRNGQKVTFTLEGLFETFEGTVYARNTSIDMETRTLLIRARSANQGRKLIPGAFASIDLELGALDNALLVPTEAIIPEQGSQKIFLYKNGQVQPSTVETGIRKAEEIQITQGLEPGDTVIISGLLQIYPGARVSISKMN